MVSLNPEQQTIADLFQEHMQAELDGDLETTMATMVDHPHLNHVPVLAGGVGREEVRSFTPIISSESSFRPTSK